MGKFGKHENALEASPAVWRGEMWISRDFPTSGRLLKQKATKFAAITGRNLRDGPWHWNAIPPAGQTAFGEEIRPLKRIQPRHGRG
jgi:hypothetical protein